MMWGEKKVGIFFFYAVTFLWGNNDDVMFKVGIGNDDVCWKGGWVKKGQNHDDVILEWSLT